MHMHRNKQFIQDIVQHLGWDVEISWDADRDCFSFSQTIDISGAPHSLFVEVIGTDPLASVFLYCPLEFPDERYSVARELVDMINMRQTCGKMNVAGNCIRYIQTIVLENCVLDPNLISNMISSAVGAFSPHVNLAISDLSNTALSIEQIIERQNSAD